MRLHAYTMTTVAAPAQVDVRSLNSTVNFVDHRQSCHITFIAHFPQPNCEM